MCVAGLSWGGRGKDWSGGCLERGHARAFDIMRVGYFVCGDKVGADVGGIWFVGSEGNGGYWNGRGCIQRES